MAAGPPTVLSVLGSATAPGRLHRALGGAAERAGSEVLDLGAVLLPPAGGSLPEGVRDDSADALAAIAAADAVVFATPVYRGSLTGLLKNLIDLTPVASLQGKPVGIVAMGNSLHHFVGADRHLRDVLAFFGALVTPVSVYLSAADFADGQPSAAADDQLDALYAVLARLHGVGRDVGERPAPLGAGRG